MSAGTRKPIDDTPVEENPTGYPVFSPAVILRYERDGDLVRVTRKGLTNHELRCVLLGFWNVLDAADRADFLGELRHYAERPLSEQPPLPRTVAGDGEEIVDLRLVPGAEW